ncbi:MAG: hypothetical protein ACFB0D_16450 [Phormidesmis sp.]
MKNAKLKRLKQLGLAVMGAYVMTGCPNTQANIGSNNSLLVNNSDAAETTVAQAAVAQETVVVSDSTESTIVDFEVCAAADWQRPSDAEQAKQLGDDARYEAALVDGPLKRASDQFWNHDVVSFTTYGLSARMEPVNLSGVWTVADELWNCYEPEATVAINNGSLAEAWLLNQEMTSIAWEGDRYVMTVAPAPTGMQVVQFNRVDELATLPLEVVNESGNAVNVVSGDWQ